MADKRLVDFDPFTGIAHYSMWDELADAMHFIAVQDADAILDRNKAEAAEANRHYGDIGHVARIPMPLYMELCRKGIAHDRKKFTEWLNDPDNRFFRTRPGTV